MSNLDQPQSQTWRARAEECRAMAQSIHNPVTRERMLRVAADYDEMAAMAAEREQLAEAPELAASSVPGAPITNRARVPA
jgi:hypothetical protein